MNNKIARIENSLILQSQFKLSVREQKVILYLISNIDAVNTKEFEKQFISIKEIEAVFKTDEKTKKIGRLYSELEDFSSQIRRKGISFLTEVEIEGKKLSGHINWFQSVVPQVRNGLKGIQFHFSNDLKPFLLELKEYARINRLEVAQFKSSYSIRLFLIFRAHREKMRKWEPNQSQLKYTLGEFRELMDTTKRDSNGKVIQRLYKKWSHLRDKVLEVTKKEVNENTNLYLDYKPFKEGRSVAGIVFYIRDSSNEKKVLKKEVKIKKNSAPPLSLTWSQRKAYDILSELGVEDGIIISQIIPKIEGSEFVGFEDYFIEGAIEHFSQKSKKGKDNKLSAGAFVIWWTRKHTYNVGNDVWSKILENVIHRKKALELNEPIKFNNRQVAATMKESDFKIWYKEQRQNPKNDMTTRISATATRMKI